MLDKSDIFDLALRMVEGSNGRLAIAHKEKDEDRLQEEEATHFLKLDEKRFGRDLELYNFMCVGSIGWEEALVYLLEELLMPIKQELPESYKAGAEKLKEMGLQIFQEDLKQGWMDLF